MCVQLEKFRVAIVEVLRRRYRDHWFPEKPCKGSGYRCIRINGKIDPIIAQVSHLLTSFLLLFVFLTKIRVRSEIDPKQNGTNIISVTVLLIFSGQNTLRYAIHKTKYKSTL